MCRSLSWIVYSVNSKDSQENLPESVKLFEVTFQHEKGKQIHSNFGMVKISCHVLLGLGKEDLPLNAGVGVDILLFLGVVHNCGDEVAALLDDLIHHLVCRPLICHPCLDVL